MRMTWMRRAWGDLRLRMAVVLTAAVVIAGVGFQTLLVSLTRSRLYEELDTRTRSLLEPFAEEVVTPLLVGDRAELDEHLRRVAKEGDVLGAAIYRRDGLRVAASIRDPRIWGAIGPPALAPGADVIGSRMHRVNGVQVLDLTGPMMRRKASRDTLVAEASELFGLGKPVESTHGQREQVGWVRIVVSTARLEQSVVATARLGFVISLIALLFGLLSVYSVVQMVVRPLHEASGLAREIAAGHLERRLPVRGHDELGALAESLNTMAGALDRAHRRARTEADALRTATEAVVAIARGARGASDPRGVFAQVAAQSRRVTGCGGAALALPDQAGERLLFVDFDPAPPWGGLAQEAALEVGVLERLIHPGRAAARLAIPQEADTLSLGLGADGFHAALLVTLALEEGPPALLLLASRDPDGFAATEVDVVVALASHLSAALHSSRLQRRLERSFEELQRVRDDLVRSEMLRVAGEMAAGVAHEFNNVLGAILGRSQLLRRRALSGTLTPEQLAASLAVVERAALDGGETVRRLRQFGRVPESAQTESVDVGEAARDAAEFTRPRWENEAQAAGRPITVSIETAAGTWVTGRSTELREVFVNLILNAVEALPDGGEIRITTAVADERVMAMVSDDGVGMSEVTRRRLFEPFFTTRGEPGTGLGMSVVYGILQRCGASIRVDSRPGGGTRIEISFPLATAPEPAAEAPRSPVFESGGALEVLVVDDEPSVRELLRDIAETLGHRTVECASGDEAVRHFRPGHFDLVLTDLGMPGMSGWKLAQSIRALDRDVVIALVTGWGDGVDPAEVAEAGADLVVPKPFTIEDILRVTQVAVHRRAVRRAA